MSDYSKLRQAAQDQIDGHETTCDPVAVLGLIADNERLQVVHDYYAGVHSERDQLKAENEALRKDAERYRWLRKKSIPLEGHDFLSSDEILDYRIDAAMGKRGQS